MSFLVIGEMIRTIKFTKCIDCYTANMLILFCELFAFVITKPNKISWLL
jgi:hypothetical protein